MFSNSASAFTTYSAFKSTCEEDNQRQSVQQDTQQEAKNNGSVTDVSVVNTSKDSSDLLACEENKNNQTSVDNALGPVNPSYCRASNTAFLNKPAIWLSRSPTSDVLVPRKIKEVVPPLITRPPGHHLTKEGKEEILKLLSERKPTKEIAALFVLKVQTARKHIRKLKDEVQNKPGAQNDPFLEVKRKPVPSEVEEKILNLLDQGRGILFIARECKVGTERVEHYSRKRIKKCVEDEQPVEQISKCTVTSSTEFSSLKKLDDTIPATTEIGPDEDTRDADKSEYQLTTLKSVCTFETQQSSHAEQEALPQENNSVVEDKRSFREKHLNWFDQLA